MTIGPAPMIRMEWMSERLGTRHEARGARLEALWQEGGRSCLVPRASCLVPRASFFGSFSRRGGGRGGRHGHRLVFLRIGRGGGRRCCGGRCLRRRRLGRLLALAGGERQRGGGQEQGQV